MMEQQEKQRWQEQNIFYHSMIGELVARGHRVTIVAGGRSMRPFIEDGRDHLVFGKAENLAVGDVILAEVTKGFFACHRIVKMEKGWITMRGDGNVNGQIEEFPEANVRAKLVQVVRKGKTYTLDTSSVWKCYSAFWQHTRPLHRYMLAFYRCFCLRRSSQGQKIPAEGIDEEERCITAYRGGHAKMRIKSGVDVYHMLGQDVAIVHETENIVLQRVFLLNELATFVWHQMKGKDFTETDVQKVILEEYEADVAKVQADVQQLVVSWLAQGLIDYCEEPSAEK